VVENEVFKLFAENISRLCLVRTSVRRHMNKKGVHDEFAQNDGEDNLRK
jgi:hypothetical protein